MNCSNAVNFVVTSPLPNGWLHQDVGPVGVAGVASYSNGTFTLLASGQWIWSTADGMHFAYQSLTGDGTIIARVASAQGTQYPQAGVMIRESLNANSAHAYVAYQPYPSAFTYFYSRTSTGAGTSSTGASITALPYWLKLVRSGNNFSGYSSIDGVSWTPLGVNQKISMAQTVYIGLALTSDDNAALATATFDNVSVNVSGSYTISAASSSLALVQG